MSNGRNENRWALPGLSQTVQKEESIHRIAQIRHPPGKFAEEALSLC